MMGIQLLSNHHEILDKFVIACQADERIIAALMFGSYVKGRNDEHSDLDLGLITSDETYDDFVTNREAFIRRIDIPLFIEDFDIPNVVFLMFGNGSEVEIHYASERQSSTIFREPYDLLLEKKNFIANIIPNKAMWI